MKTFPWKPFAIFAVIVALAPTFAGNPYYIMLLTFAGLNAIVSIGMCVLIGYAGQISLGHAAFFALGGYTSAILTTRFHWPVWAGFIAAIALTSAVAFVIGLPALRLRGHYLAMATLGFGEIIYQVILSTVDITGGSSGLSDIPPLTFFGFDMTSGDGIYFFFFIWFIVGLEILLMTNLIRSRTGRALMAIHGNEDAANSIGINTAAYKLKIFVISAALAALAGFLYAHKEKYIGVDRAELMFSVILVAMVAVGGMANLWGTLVATVLLTLLPEFLATMKDMPFLTGMPDKVKEIFETDILAYGLIIILIMMFMPGGIFAGLSSLGKSVKSKFKRKVGSRQ